MLFAANIAALMEVKGTDASKLARDAGMNKTGIYDIIKGKSRNPRLDTVEKIAAALDVPASALIAERSLDELQSQLYGVLLDLEQVERDRLLLTARAWADHQTP